MATAPQPPPPPPLASAAPAPQQPQNNPNAGGMLPFSVKGLEPETAKFELRDCKEGAVSLRVVVSRYLSAPQQRTFGADRLQLILGRLRCLDYTLKRYNQLRERAILAAALDLQGTDDNNNNNSSDSDTTASNEREALRADAYSFWSYWRRRTLDLLSGFGFSASATAASSASSSSSSSSSSNPNTQRTQLQLPALEIIGLSEIIAKVEEIYAPQISAARQLIQDGLITFDGLCELYRPDVPVRSVVSGLGGSSAVFLVTEYYYEERRSLFGIERSFHFTLEFAAAVGEHFALVRFSEALSGWMGVRERQVSELTYVPVRIPRNRIPPAVSGQQEQQQNEPEKPAQDKDLDHIDIDSLQVAGENEFAALRQRGENYVRLVAGGGSRFLAYRPSTFFLHAQGGGGKASGGGSMSSNASSQLSKGGRIMIDPLRGATLGHNASQGGDEPSLAMMQTTQRYRRWKNISSGSNSGNDGSSGSGGSGNVTGKLNMNTGNAGPVVTSDPSLILWEGSPPAELIACCWPALVGFSFTAKSWGHVLMTGLEPINFNDRAFEQLVLAEERKQLILALVQFGSDVQMDDIVGGKRGGSVFLMHGPPGVGKTLTAEAIAEVLHRPLYYVTMGELGLTPEEMERRLSDVLELCAAWDALVILDEADVFLEKRGGNGGGDIVRNAMVCVMLRLIEYYPGILFLTTNRVRSFDPALESRVTVALRYDALGAEARAEVWRNLLTRAAKSGIVRLTDLSDSDYAQLGSQHVLNGRQIKNAVRLAAALARSQQSALDMAVLQTTLRIMQQGRDEMQSGVDPWQ